MNQVTDRQDLISLCTVPATIQSLKSFCRALFYAKVDDLNLKEWAISLKFQCTPFRPNGYVQAIRTKKKWKFYISINLWHVSKNKCYSNAERYFYASATLCHELHHVYLQVNGEKNRFDNYLDYIAFMEANGRFSNNYLAEVYSMIFSIKKYHQYRKYKYITTPAELVCMRYGYADSLSLLDSILSKNEKIVIERIVESISLVYETIEVSYLRNSQPINLFAKLLGNVVTASRKKSDFTTRYPQFRLLLQETGDLRDFEDIYRIGKAEQLTYCADVVVRLFFFADESSLMKKGLPDDMYNDIERWANKYIAMGIRYLQTKDLAKVILSDQIVEDNAAVIIKNITLLNRRMTLLGMKHNIGNVLPIYKI
jgi:hypothetical protein